MLIEHIQKNKIVVAASKYIIDDYKPPVTNIVSQVYPTQIAPGLFNPLKKKTIFNTFAINSVFRDSDSKSSTDCLIMLPYTIKDVIAMRIISIELPNSLYLIENGYNTIYFIEYGFTSPTKKTVIFPIGNYTLADLATMMTTQINIQMNSIDRFVVTIDPVTLQTTITNTTFIFEFYIKTGETQYYLYKSIGWTLGFRNAFGYVNLQSYTSESLFNQFPTDYLFLEINDYNKASASRLIGLFADSFLDKNIIAKIPYKPTIGPIFVSSEKLISSNRNYFGPIHLQKIGVRLLNQFGEIVDLHLRDFSFTIELEVLYDL